MTIENENDLLYNNKKIVNLGQLFVTMMVGIETQWWVFVSTGYLVLKNHKIKMEGEFIMKRPIAALGLALLCGMIIVQPSFAITTFTDVPSDLQVVRYKHFGKIDY